MAIVRPFVSRFLLPALALAAGIVASPGIEASSHREAPFITRMPKVDGTDFYMFRSYEPGRSGFVTLVANYIPLQDAYGGPNFFMLDPDALYEIHIDNTGDGREDITFQFRFRTVNKNTALTVGGKSVPIPLIQSGPIAEVNPASLNVRETYTVDVVTGDRRSGVRRGTLTNAATGSNVFDKPVDNIGQRTIPDYAAYAAKHVYNVNIPLPGCATQGRLFVGQRKDSFVVNLGEIFDLINIPPARVLGSRSGGRDVLEDKNVTSFVLEAPIACLTSGSDPVIGGWTTASVRQGRLVNPAPVGTPGAGKISTASKEGGPFVQVSRLGMPLVNELVIGLRDKDRFNASRPTGDAQFLDYVTNPTLPALIETLFGGAVRAPTRFPRSDLVAVFLTGVAGVNQPASGAPSEMLRLNTALPATPAASQNSLGAALCFVRGVLTLTNPGCDPAGFPNGRRPGDDVVDIELRVAMGYLLPDADAPSGQQPFTDGALVDSSFFDAAFPYLRTPLPGSPNGANGVAANP